MAQCDCSIALGVETHQFTNVQLRTLRTNMTQLGALHSTAIRYACFKAAQHHMRPGCLASSLGGLRQCHAQQRLSGSLKNEALARSMHVSRAKLSRSRQRRSSGACASGRTSRPTSADIVVRQSPSQQRAVMLGSISWLHAGAFQQC